MPGKAWRKLVGRAALGAMFLTSAACYHTIVKTNLAPGTEVHHEGFVPAFIYGLVPATVDASSYCAGKKWAKVETQMSFLNGLVAGFTFQIFTPMDVTVTCAAS